MSKTLKEEGGVRTLALLMSAVVLVSCERAIPKNTAAPAVTSGVEPSHGQREIRLTGIVEAVHSFKIVVPQLTGQNNQMTLTGLIPNGSRVKEGDPVAEFDPTAEMDRAREAKAKYEDLGHQVDQKVASNHADAERRQSDLKQAEADLGKALLDLEKAPILAEIIKRQNEVRAGIAREHVDSLKKSNALHDQSDAAALRILELQRDRQKVALERAQGNLDKLRVKAPLGGMVAHANVYRNGSMTHAQEGDQMYRGNPLVNIFDPSEMQVRCAVGEPDGVVLAKGTRATIYLDAYPDLALSAHFEYASPIATSALSSPIKSFTAIFKLDKADPHLMPDLSAAVVIHGRAEDRSAK
jgi:multidrug resistance efflux pump